MLKKNKRAINGLIDIKKRLGNHNKVKYAALADLLLKYLGNESALYKKVGKRSPYEPLEEVEAKEIIEEAIIFLKTNGVYEKKYTPLGLTKGYIIAIISAIIGFGVLGTARGWF